MIEIDGINYNADWVTGLEITADILNGKNAGRLQGTGSMFLDPIGTFFNTHGTIFKKSCTDEEWDDLYLRLCDRTGKHNVKIPFLQGTLQLDVYVARVQRKLIGYKYNKNIWDNKINITLTAMKSSWPAGQPLSGYTENKVI